MTDDLKGWLEEADWALLYANMSSTVPFPPGTARAVIRARSRLGNPGWEAITEKANATDPQWPFDAMEVGHFCNDDRGGDALSRITGICPTEDGQHVKMITAIKEPFRPGPEGADDVWFAYAPGAAS